MDKDVLVDELLCSNNPEVFVEVNGVVYPVHDVQDTSQGTIIIVDTFQETRSLYPAYG